jgi:hypothetical protein
MTFLVWPFVDADSKWKTSFVDREPAGNFGQSSIFFGFIEGDPGPHIFSAPTDQHFRDSQFRLSSNFNSRKLMPAAKPRPIIRKCFPKLKTKRYQHFGKLDVKMRTSQIRKVLRKRVPVWNNHEYVESGKFRNQRYFDPRVRRWINVPVPIMVRKIKLFPGAKKGDLKTNALWFEEKVRECSGGQVFSQLFSEDSPPEFISEEQYFGPWTGFPDSSVGHLGNLIQLCVSEYSAACQVDPPMIQYSAEIAALDQKVVAKLYSKVLNQKVDLATALAEGAKTVSMIADLSKRLVDFFLGIYRLNPTRFLSGLRGLLGKLLPSSPKKLANDFLAYRYGITPLVSDLSGSVEAIAEYFDSNPKVYTRSRSRVLIDNGNQAATTILNDFSRKVLVDKVSIEIAYKVTYAIEGLGTRRLTELGFTNPVNVEWELVPFSFVVDWFLPIGNYLRSLTSFNQLAVKECHRTTVIKITKQLLYTAPVNPNWHPPAGGGEVPGWNYAFGGWTWVVSDMICVREIIPLPSLPLPTFKNPFSLGHFANAFALFVQLFSKK